MNDLRSSSLLCLPFIVQKGREQPKEERSCDGDYKTQIFRQAFAFEGLATK